MNQKHSALNPADMRIIAKRRYQTARIQLFFAILCTTLNILLSFTSSTTYFLFSIYFPYSLVAIGQLFHNEYDLPASVLAIYTVIALLILVVYLLCFLFSKKRSGFLIAALVLFSLDTGYFFYDLIISRLFLSGLVDVIFHLWVLIYLVIGVVSIAKVKKLPVEAESDIIESEDYEEIESRETEARNDECGVDIDTPADKDDPVPPSHL